MPDDVPPFALVLVMAGAGTRFGGSVPKPFVEVDGAPLWFHAARPFVSLTSCRGVVLVAPEERVDELALDAAERLDLDFAVLAGGERRQDSVRLGVDALADLFEAPDEAPAVVAVHDAARPLVTPATVAAVIRAAGLHGAALAAAPATDTLKEVTEDGLVRATVDRDRFWHAQTPQCFRADVLRAAHAEAGRRDLEATDCAALVEYMGLPVAVVRSDRWNLKVTEPADLDVVRALLAARRAPVAR